MRLLRFAGSLIKKGLAVLLYTIGSLIVPIITIGIDIILLYNNKITCPCHLFPPTFIIILMSIAYEVDVKKVNNNMKHMLITDILRFISSKIISPSFNFLLEEWKDTENETERLVKQFRKNVEREGRLFHNRCPIDDIRMPTKYEADPLSEEDYKAYNWMEK